MARRNSIFHFKQFSVNHSDATMKVGTDAVLLGAWANVEGARRILDIGTGSGVIALMLAQRSIPEALIDAVEIESNDANQAQGNVANSPWPQKVAIHHTSIQLFKSETAYDRIVSNPPYFSNSFKPQHVGRKTARHTGSLTLPELLTEVISRLHQQGTFSVVLPYAEGQSFTGMAISSGLRLTRECTFRGRRDKPAERLLLEFRKEYQNCEVTSLNMYNPDNTWSDEYIDLTKSFYLKF